MECGNELRVGQDALLLVMLKASLNGSVRCPYCMQIRKVPFSVHFRQLCSEYINFLHFFFNYLKSYFQCVLTQANMFGHHNYIANSKHSLGVVEQNL
jgi:hypothetical protein